jgi:hypothetical protein
VNLNNRSLSAQIRRFVIYSGSSGNSGAALRFALRHKRRRLYLDSQSAMFSSTRTNSRVRFALRATMCVAVIATSGLLSVGCAIGAHGQAGGLIAAASLSRTRVHIVTPFSFDGQPLLDRPLSTAKGRCTAGSPMLITNVYTCAIAGPAFGCKMSCELPACWRDFTTKALSMICLGSPGLDPGSPAKNAVDELRVRVLNHPRLAKPAAHPLEAEPWAFKLANGETCTDGSAGSYRPGSIPALLYVCSGPLFPMDAYSDFHRDHPIWTVRAASSVAQAAAHRYPIVARIAEAWFAGNSRDPH